MVNKQGETDIEHLYAIGETSFTGLHGANRMASNSLLECFVVAFGAAKDIQDKISSTAHSTEIDAWDESRVRKSKDEVLISHNWDELRRCMWDFVGIVRNDERLHRAERRIKLLREEVQSYYSKHRVTKDMLELRNLALVAELIIACAIARKESRGLHFTQDYTELEETPSDTILEPASWLG